MEREGLAGRPRLAEEAEPQFLSPFTALPAQLPPSLFEQPYHWAH